MVIDTYHGINRCDISYDINNKIESDCATWKSYGGIFREIIQDVPFRNFNFCSVPICERIVKIYGKCPSGTYKRIIIW